MTERSRESRGDASLDPGTGAAPTPHAGRAPDPPSPPEEAGPGIDRRGFLTRTGAGMGALAATGPLGGILAACEAPAVRVGGRGPEIVVIGAGAFGGWAALHLREMGARVTLLDMYGPGNSRSTSGDETRGVRTSYANRDLWTSWAARAIGRWEAFDAEWAERLGGNLFFRTGDVILRDSPEGFVEEMRATWDATGGDYETMTAEEAGRRWPQIDVEGFEVALYEPHAGVVRARAACQRVADVFRRKGGEVRVGKAGLGAANAERLDTISVEGGEALGAEIFVFALGPWFPKAFPEVMADRIRAGTLGHVYYFGTPPGDDRFSYPNMPSWSVPGVTGWPTLPPDHRGFRVRTGGRAAADPDTSVRWIPEEYLDQPRRVIAERFPGLADQPIVETRACHYESSSTRNWIIDRHPGHSNVWFAGGGSAEGFKFGPVVGELIADRVLGRGGFAELDDTFRLDDEMPEGATPPRAFRPDTATQDTAADPGDAR